MIQIQIPPFKNFTAILACIAIPLEDVMAGKFHFFLWQAVKQAKQNDSRNTNPERNCVNAVGMWLFLRKVLPLGETVRLKCAPVIVEDNLSVSFKQKCQGSSHSADVYRLPQSVENQHMLIQV